MSDAHASDASSTRPRASICYYSATGNTRLACSYVARRLGVECELIDVTLPCDVDLAPYDVVGLAAPTDFGGLPQRFLDFLCSLPEQGGKPAFALNTYGFASALTLRDLDEQATARGFTVVGAHSLRTPENYPPMIAIGLGGAKTLPKPKAMRAFDIVIDELAATIGTLGGMPPERHQVRLGFFGARSRPQPRTTARDDMGDKFVDADLCTECGTCAKGCPYGAIALGPKPVFDMKRCYGCWRCYNRCPERAISTAKFHGTPYYLRPAEHARAVLGE